MRIRYLALMMLMVSVLTLGGCKATPPVVEDRGINRAMSDAEVAASETVSGALLPFEEIKAQNGRVIDTVLYGEDRTALAVKAQVTVAQVDEVPLLTLKEAPVDIEPVKRAFFGDRAQEATKNDTYKDDAPGTEWWELPPLPNKTVGPMVQWLVLSEDRGICIFYYSNDYESILYNDFPDDKILPYLEDVSTPDEAKSEALLDEKLGQLGLGIQGHTLRIRYPSTTNKKTGSYLTEYLPNYGCLPTVGEEAVQTDIGGRVLFSVKGIVEFSLKTPKIAEATGVVDEMLGIDQALDIVREHLGKGLNPRQDKAIEEITLSYRYTKDGATGEYSAYPVWLFYMEYDPPLSGDYGGRRGEKIEYEQFDESFIVDARSGVLEVITTSRVEVA